MPAEEFIDPHLPGDPAWAYVATDGVVTVSSARLNGAPLYLIDGACHCAELNQLSPVPRPEPGIAAFRGAWERVGGLLGAPIPQPPLDDERILVLAGEGCTLADGEGVRTLEEPWPIEVPAWSTLRTTGRALLALTSGGTTWALVSLAPDTEILFDAPGRDLVRSLLTRGGARFQHVGRGALANRFSVLVGEAPGSQDLFRPLARVWDLEGDLVVEAHERPRAYALSGRVVAETQKADDVAVGRLLGTGDVVEVGAGAVTPAEAGDAWWADGFYRPPPSEAVRQLRRVGNVALGVMVLGLVALGVGWADHGRYEPALEDLRREGESLRMSLSDGAVRRLDLQTLTTQDYGGRWWSYEPLTDAWFVSVADEWLSATPPRYSSRRPWVIVGSLLAVVGGVVAVATLLMQ